MTRPGLLTLVAVLIDLTDGGVGAVGSEATGNSGLVPLAPPAMRKRLFAIAKVMPSTKSELSTTAGL